MTRFARVASSAAAAVLAFGLAASPALARGAAPAVPQGLSIDSIVAGQPAPGDPAEDVTGTPGLLAAAFTATPR